MLFLSFIVKLKIHFISANLVPDQNIATVLAMAGLSGQTSAGPLASSAETMANNQMRQNQMMDQSATMSMQSNAALQANEQALLSQTVDLPAAQGTKAIPGLMGRLTGQMGNMSPEVLQLLAQAQSSGIDPRMMLAGFSQGPAQLSIAPGTAIQGADGSLNIKMKANSGTQIQAQVSSESGTIMAGGAGMIPPPSKMTGAVDKRIPFGQDAMIYEGASNTKQGAVDKRIPYGQDAMIYEGAPMAPGPNTPVGKDTMAPPTAEETASSQQISSQTFAGTTAQQNAITDKTANAANLGPNMLMDPTMLQNMMKMRLSPDMLKYVQFGAQGVNMIGQSGGMTGFENLFKQSQGMQQTAGNQQVNVDAMTGATNQGGVSMVDMADMTKTAGLSEINQPQVEKSIITQEVISNPVQTQSLQEQSGMAAQGLAENRAMSQMQQGITGRQGMAQIQGGMSGQQRMTQEQEMAQMHLEMTGQQEHGMTQMQSGTTGQEGMTQEQAMAQMQSSLTGQQGMTQEQLMAQLQSGMTGQTGQTVSSATFQQPDINVMNMGKLFGGKPGLIGGGIMAGTSKSDLSGVQYETANKMAVANQAGMTQQSSDPILRAEIGSAGQISEASATDQASATTDSLFGQGSAFSAGNNQLMGQFGFGSMNQVGDQSAVMSEVVSAPQDAITAQQIGPETSGTSGAFAGAVDASASAQSSMDVAAQTVSDVKSTADFTPIGSIGTFTSVSNVGPANPVTEQQWSWDPTSQTWVLVAASEVQASAQAQAADGVLSNQAQTQSAVDSASSISQVQTEGIVSTSQADTAQAIVNQQNMATDMSAMDQQVGGVSESQTTQLSAGDQVMGQSGQTDLAGYQWNAGANAYIRVQSPDQAQAQANAAVNQATDVQAGMTQGAPSDIASAMQQYDGQTQAQMTAESLSQAGAASTMVSDQGTGQVGQTWEQAGYQWDAATNAYVPVGTLKQSVADSAQVGTISEAATAVDQASVQSGQSVGAGAMDMSASGSMQMSGSFDMSVRGAGDTSVAQQLSDQAQTTLYQQPNQLDAQAVMDAKTTLYQPPDQGITHQDARLDISGSQSADMSVTADIAAGQQQGQTSATEQQMTQQGVQQMAGQSQQQVHQAAQQDFQQQGAQPGFQQADFTQWVQQQQQQQAGNLAAQGTMQESQQQSGLFPMQGSVQTDQIQGQDAGFQQKQDLRQSASAFDMTAQQSLSAEGRSKDFQQSPQQQTQSGAGPLMLETQPWEQQGTNTQLNQQQQIDVTGTSSFQVSQTSQQTGLTGIDQASQQQQWGQQAGQQVSQQSDLSGMMQGSAQQQAVQDASQAAQNAQMQQWLAAQNVNTQASPTSAGPVQMTSGQWQQTGAATGGADAMGSAAAAMVSAQMQQQQAGAAAMAADANAAKQMQQVGSGAAQATDMQTWNQNMQTQTEVQGTQTVAQGTQTATVGTQTDTSFTPIGQTGSGADATATAWQAILAAAQAEAQKSMGIQTPAVTPIVTGQVTGQQTAGQQFFAQQTANQQAAMQQAAAQQAAMQQAAAQQAAAQQAASQQAAAQKAAAQQQSTVSWAEIINAAMAHQAETAKQQQAVQAQQQARPQVPAWATGMQTQQTQQASNTQVNQQQTVEAKPTPPQQPKTEPQRKIPIRPDPVTRDRVREMFISQMRQRPDIDPLQILIGLSPEMLMRSGVNPRIARSGEVAQIVPAVERALGISLRRRRGRGGRPRSDIGGAFADPMGGHTFSGPEPMGGRGQRGQSARDRAMQRRKFMMEQRMINEVMQLFGLGPEPLEPGDPGYRPPGQRGGRGGGAGPGMPGMGPDPMMGAGGAGMGGGAGGPAGNPQNRMMMELLGM